MRAVGAASWLLASASIVALAALLAPERASAACYNVLGEGIVAHSGDNCTAAAGVYKGLPAAHPPQGVGFYATGTGSITGATGTISITTPAYGVQADGGQISLTNAFTTVTTSGASAYGFYSENGGLISLNNFTTSVSTTGASAYGFYAQSGGQITVSATPPDLVRVLTEGAGAFGLYASGAGSNITIDTVAIIRTAGAGADGVVAEADDVVSLASGGQVTTGYNTSSAAVGVLAKTGGKVTLTGVSVTTSGANSAGIEATGGDGTTGGQSRVTTAVLAGESPTPTTVATTGDQSPGVQADTGGQVTLNGGTVMTSGAGATGLYAAGVDETTGAKSTITATNLAVMTGANPPSDGPPLGAGAVGVLAEAGGHAILTGGSVTTNGNSAYAVVAHSGGLVQLTGTSISTLGNGSGGLAINGAGSEIDATNVTISTLGGSDSSTGPLQHSYGVYNGPFGSFPAGGVARLTDTSVSTQSDQMHGVNTSTGGSTTILGGSITTKGFDANAIYTQNGGITTVGASASGPTTLATKGNDAYAVVAVSGGFVSLTGSQISTATGTIGSGGIAVHDAGSEVDATNVSITTLGGFDSKTLRGAYGLYNGPFGESVLGGVAKLTNSTIATSGDQMFAVVTLAGGSTTISGGLLTTSGLGASGVVTEGGGYTSVNGASVSTTGQDSHALFVAGPGSQANLGGTNTFATQRDGAIGLYATNGGGVTATGPVTITTGGGVSPATSLGAYGVNADGAGSQIALTSVTITTSGAGATGLFASDAASSGAAGSITVAGTLALKTTNAAAAAIALQGNAPPFSRRAADRSPRQVTRSTSWAERTRSRPSTISASPTRRAI
jgi:hypothetical protein